MSSNNAFKSDLYSLYNVVQSSMMTFPKEVIIGILRDFFAKDSYYHFSKDAFGFPNTTDHTDLPPGADLPSGPGYYNNGDSYLSTRLFIGEIYHKNVIHYPSILVKNNSSKYAPISINRNKETVEYSDIIYEDGYGNKTYIKSPAFYVTAGVWEGSINIDILTRSLRARDDLTDLVMLCFSELTVDYLYDIGLIIKPPSVSGISETDDRNDKLYKATISFDIRQEWLRKIPISSFIDTIFFSVEFQDLQNKDSIAAPNLTINTEITLLETILNF